MPDVTHIDIAKLSPNEAATVAYALDVQVKKVFERLNELAVPARAKIAEAQSKVFEAIKESGGNALPDEHLRIELKQKTERQKRIDILRELFGKVPGTELKGAIFLMQPPPEWRADLRKLDPLAKKYGGEVREIIERGSPTVEIGAPVLVIEEKV